MSKETSQQLQDKIKQYQNIQQKMAGIQQQIQALEMDKMEIDKALKEIEDMPDDETCYRSIGRLMIKSTIKETKEKLTNQKELTETRIGISEKSNEKLKKQYDELLAELKKAYDTDQ